MKDLPLHHSRIETAISSELSMFKDFVMPVKNQIQLSSGAVLTINTYKMYVFDYDDEVTKDNARDFKFDFIESIANNDGYFKKDFGKVPVGFVIQVQYKDFLTEGFLYGCSVKSHLDKWNRMKGLKVAYADLMKNFAEYSISLSKDERRKVAEIVGLN